MDDISRYKIIGDVYEIQEDGTLVHVPKNKVLSRMAYTHERYIIIDRKRPIVSQKRFYSVTGWLLITVTVFVALWKLLPVVFTWLFA